MAARENKNTPTPSTTNPTVCRVSNVSVWGNPLRKKKRFSSDFVNSNDVLYIQ